MANTCVCGHQLVMTPSDRASTAPHNIIARERGQIGGTLWWLASSVENAVAGGSDEDSVSWADRWR